MDDPIHKSNLYRWKRQEGNKLYSRSQRITTNTDVHDWIKKVEEASDHAAEEVFGDPELSSQRNKYKNHGSSTRHYVRDQDQALTEAQELLSQWMEEKVSLESELDVSDEAWYQPGLQADVKRQWDHLLEDNQVQVEKTHRKTSAKDPYVNIYEMEDKDAVNMVLNNLMEKEVINESVVKKLGKEDNSRKPDPRMKMEMRHKQVKENREKRQADLDQRRQKAMSKKETQFAAKQILLKEEKDKAVKMKHEEMQIQKEMAHIRKEMQEEKKRAEESRERKRLEKERVELLSQTVISEQKEETKRERDNQRDSESKRRQILLKFEQLQARQAAVNLKILQRHFSAWYSVVLERHMKLGKAKAIGDWRCLLKAWNGWKSHCRNKKLQVETQRYQTDVIQTHRKTCRAENHFKSTILRKCFQGWIFWVQEEKDRRDLEEAQSQTRNKMMAFLNAAATGQLWQKSQGEIDTQSEIDSGARPNSAMVKVDEMFESSNHKKPALSTRPSTARSSFSENDFRRIPTEAWQVTRKHLNLTPEEIASLGGGDIDDSPTDGSKPRKRLGKVPWNIPQMPVNSFENRHKAQQKILEQQQKQLKEQQRIIEELQFNQQNHALQQQLIQQQQELQKKLDDISNNVQLPEKKTEPMKNPNREMKPDKTVTNGIKQPEEKGSLTTRSTSSVNSTTSQSDAATSSTITSKTSNTKYLNVLKKMEDRAAERARIKEERDLKRQKAELEKIKKLQEEEAEILQRQEEEKRARVEAYREKKRLEKQKEEERIQSIEKFKQLNAKADQHYLRSLLKYRGILPMKRLVQLSHSYDIKASEHARTSLMRKTFMSWHVHVKTVMKSKYEMADEMHQYLAVRHCFNNWKNYKNIMSVLEKKAQRHYQKTLLYKVFVAWTDITAEEKVAGWEKERHAREHNIIRIKKKAFKIWHAYPEYRKLEEKRERRKADMRRKVAALLPDFKQSAELT